MNVWTNKEVFLEKKKLIQGVFIYASLPPPPPPPPGLLFMDCVGNKWNKIAVNFWWSRQGMVKHPLSFSQYFRSSFKQEALSATTCHLSEIANGKYIVYSIQIEYLLIINISYDYKNWQSGGGVLMTHFRVETEVCTIWSISNVKIVRNEGD